MRNIALILTLLATPANAGCPDAPNHSARLSELITAAQVAPDENTAKRISRKMWELWANAPDEIAQSYLDAGMSRRERYDFSGAIGEFNQLVAYCPDYAEGYNQRAFVNFLRQDYAPALEDLDRAIALSPRHIAAIAGKALTLIGLGRDGEAQEVLREAVRLNPWLNERHLLKDAPPQPETDL